VNWKDNAGKALYIDRLGVNVNYSGKGIGSYMLTKARETAKSLSAEYLRLFVVDINGPAIRLYTKNGFTKAAGVYDEVIDDDLVLHEYGYEILL
jgi:ribosomal protein S18 acetylase RimI-like enzyme